MNILDKRAENTDLLGFPDLSKDKDKEIEQIKIQNSNVAENITIDKSININISFGGGTTEKSGSNPVVTGVVLLGGFWLCMKWWQSGAVSLASYLKNELPLLMGAF